MVIAAQAALDAFNKKKDEALANGTKDEDDPDVAGCWLANVDFFGKSVDIMCEIGAAHLKIALSVVLISMIEYV